MTADLISQVNKAHRAIDENRLADATDIVMHVEGEMSAVTNIGLKHDITGNLAGVMIDLGSYTNDENLLV